MHGLILAGGLGSRLAADGVTDPKPLVRVGGRPQLLRLCETLDALGCATVTCMVRAGVPTDSIVGNHPRWRAIACDTPSSLHTLALGLEAAPPGPVFCTMVDTIMPWESWTTVWDAWHAAEERGVMALLAVTHPSARDQHPLCVEVDEAGWITSLGGSRSASSLVTAGVYGFEPTARPLAAQAVARGIHRMRGFLASLTEDGRRMHTAYVARALDLDRRDDLDEANAWAPMVTP